MRTRRRAFALIVVLIAIASVFALAMRSAVVSRTTVIESGALEQRSEAMRGARSAVVLVVGGLRATDAEALAEAEEERGLSAGGVGAVGGVSGAVGEQGDQMPELPPFLIELLGLEEVAEGADEVIQERARRFARAASAEGVSTGGAQRAIDAFGLPARAIEFEMDGRVYRVTLRDAASTLDASTPDERTLLAWFEAIGVEGREARRLTDRWLDWVDEDRVTRTYGAEDGAYEREGVRARNGELAALEELLAIEGMTPEIYEFVRRDWAVVSLGRVHAMSSSEAVLASLPGSSAEAARAIVEARLEGPLTAEALERLIPMIGGASMRERLTLRSSGVLRVRVDVLDPTSRARTMTLEGAAVIEGSGLRRLALRFAD